MACTESIPVGPITLSLPGDPETGNVGYREEVHHPALPFPKVATGTLGISTSGKLIRHQKTPDIEIVEIGEDVLQVRKGEDGEPNMLPIPSDMKGIFGFLRTVASSPERTIQQTTETLRQPDPAGWHMPFGTFKDNTSIWLLGCGTQMAGFLVRTGDGIERRTTFQPASGKAE